MINNFSVTIRTCFVELFSLYEKLFASASYDWGKNFFFSFPVFSQKTLFLLAMRENCGKLRIAHVTWHSGPDCSKWYLNWLEFLWKYFIFHVSHKVIFNLFIFFKLMIVQIHNIHMCLYEEGRNFEAANCDNLKGNWKWWISCLRIFLD